MASKKVFLLAVLAAIIATTAVTALQIPQPQVMEKSPYSPNYSKLPGINKLNKVKNELYINPKSVFRSLKPGETVSISVTVKNIGRNSVKINPRIVHSTLPFTNNLPLPKSWVNFSPAKTILKPKETVMFHIKISVPKNASNGEYSCQIVLTNDSVYMPYILPSWQNHLYIYSISITVDVRKPPDVIIYPSYLSATVLKGESKTLKIFVKNTGNRYYSMHPTLSTPEYISEYVEPIGKDMVRISYPEVIPPNSTVTVNVTFMGIKAGRYSGKLLLNINDSNLELFRQSVYLSLTVITPPKKPYVRKILVSNLSRLEITVRVSPNAGSEVKLISPNGDAFKPESVSESFSVYRRVSPNIPIPKPYPIYPVTEENKESSGYYTAADTGMEYHFTVVKPENGVWKLLIKTTGYANVKIQKFY